MKEVKIVVNSKPIKVEDFSLLTPSNIYSENMKVKLTGTLNMKEVQALLFLANSWHRDDYDIINK